MTAAADYIFIGCANGQSTTSSYLGVDVASALNPSQMVSQKKDAKYPDTIGIVYDDWNKKTSLPIQEDQKQILPHGSFITCSCDDTVMIWNLDPHMKDMNIYKRNIFSQELMKVIYTDPSLNYLRDVNYNPAGASGDRIGNIRIHDLELNPTRDSYNRGP
ncbi:MAPKBP1 [Mytilus coruscus]|uniref:MAPKBP1 n=1 Tax=Mytilus coruscus TaxID=42192 RepID=A0A6J8E8A9_MYTCO|nr:MAPKBP1 [Mytilus coruscus]